MFSFNLHQHKYKHVHFIGIGGISMSGLAEILLTNGYKVSGSDMKESSILDRLRNLGGVIYIGHHQQNIQGADLIVYTSAISKSNPEYQEALKMKIETVDRATFLGQLMKGYQNSIAVAGTHGKTTTTAMISIILNNSKLSPTILLGGILDQIGGNVKIGKEDYFLTEACEYKGSFLKFYHTMGVILNIEEDHLDYFKNIDEIIDTFKKFASFIPREGFIIINSDDQHTPKIIQNLECNIVTFGLNSNSDFYATDITFTDEGYPDFILHVKNKNTYKVALGVMGIHNIYNALAAIATTYNCGIPMDTILDSLKEYKGTHRRFENKGIFKDVKIVDDYAHHPTEIRATLSTAKKITPNRLWCVFQPHTYTRTKALLNDFSDSFYDADKVIVSDIYAAREKDTGLIHSKDLVKELNARDIDAIYIDDFDKIADYLYQNTESGDIVITMGAGDIYKVGDKLLEKQY